MKFKFKLLLIILNLIVIVLFIIKRPISSKYESLDYDKIINSPFIFVLGSPGSGTTLMKTIIDVSPRVNCKHETSLISYMIKKTIQYKQSHNSLPKEYMKTIDKALSLFIMEMIVKSNHKSFEILCVKDSENMRFIDYLNDLFPNAKFVFMIS